MPSSSPPITPLNNFRDLGGTPVEGGFLRHGAIWRSDDPSTAPEHEIADLVTRGLRTVVDLRGDIEVGLSGRGFLGSHDVAYHRFPLSDGPAAREAFELAVRKGGTPRHVGVAYASSAVANIDAIAEIVRIIADSPGATLFHCTAGKDRTGMVAAGILALLGASDETIVADYIITDAAWPRILERIGYVVEALMAASGVPETAPRIREPESPVSAFEGAKADTMATMLEVVRNKHGGFPRLLRDAGVTPDLERRFRERVLAPAD